MLKAVPDLLLVCLAHHVYVLLQVRAMAGLRTISWPYHQRGLVATVATTTPNDTAWQRFLPTGPLALLPVRDGYSNIVWTLTPELAVQMEQYSPQQLAGEWVICVLGGGVEEWRRGARGGRGVYRTSC